MGLTSLSVTGHPITVLPTTSTTNKHNYPSLKFPVGSKSFNLKSEKKPSFYTIKASAAKGSTSSMSNTTNTIEKLGVKVVRNPPESMLTDLGVRQWPKWGCGPSNFPWTYDAKETCYLLKGKVKVYPEGSSEAVEIGAGDLVVFPKGMNCTWDVSETVDKHYNFE